MLADLNLLHHLPERRTITRAILANNPHLLSALSLLEMNHNLTIPKTFGATSVCQHPKHNFVHCLRTSPLAVCS